MATALTERFRFFSPAQTQTPFHVAGFSGVEGLHRLFDFHIDLVCADAAVNTAELLAAPCRFEILRDGDAAPAIFSGYPAAVEQRGFFNGYAWYAVHLRPAFWKLTRIRQSAVFLDKKLEDVLRELMTSQPFFHFPHEFRLTDQGYPAPEFAMQYQESLYDYMCWRMEEQGVYFYFEEKDGADTVIFADAPQSHDTNAVPRLFYAPGSGLEGDLREEVIVTFSLRQTPLPRRVALRSYDWRNPNTPVVGMADVDANGLGDVYLSNEYVDNDADAARLATIRAQELRCRGRLFHGTSSAPTLRPGRIFRLDRHYNPAFNRDYLVTAITHEGRQDAYLSLGLGIPLRDADERLYYRNTFTCMEADVPYRPARTAPRNHISGVLRAFVAGDGSGARAETDEYGRYKLTFPFDLSGRTGGNASCWIRRAQPQVGKDSGLSLPLLPGTEVLVSFVDGNPDLPVIAGALANGETGSISNAGNTNIQGLRTPGGNQLTINDTDCKQGISLATANGSGLTIAAGSLDSAQLTTAHYTEAAGVGATKLAGLFQSRISGFKNSSSAKRLTGAEAWFSFICKGLKDVSTSVLDSLSSSAKDSKTKEDMQWSSAGIKMALTLLETGSDNFTSFTKRNKEISKPDYGGTLLASNDAAKTELRVDPSQKELVAYVVLYLLSQLGAVGSNTATAVKKFSDAPSSSMDAYKQALAKAMEALYDYNAATYKKYQKTSDEKENSVYYNYLNAPCPCAYYEDVSSDMAKCLSELTVRNDELKNAEKEYNKAKEEFDADPAKKGELDDKGKKLKDAIDAAKAKLCDKEKLENILSELKKAWSDACEKLETNDIYYRNTKNSSLRNFSVDTVTKLLPEVVATALLCKRHQNIHKYYSRIGGLLLQSKDRNITMTAQDSIAMHSRRGILRNTRDLPRAEDAPSAQALGQQGPSLHSAPINILQPYAKNPAQPDMSAANAWGVEINANAHATDFMAEIDSQRWHEGNNIHPPAGQQQDDTIRKGATFIADATELEYRRNRWSYQRSEENAVIAGDRELFLKGGNGIISLQEHQPGAHSLILSTSHKDGQIRLRSQETDADEPCTEAEFSPQLLALGYKRQRDDDNYQTSLSMTPDELLLEQGESAIEMDRDGVLMSMEGKAVVACLPQGKVRLAGTSIDIGNVQISDNRIVGAGNGVLEIGKGAIKITGATATVNAPDFNNALNELRERLRADMEKTFSQEEGAQLRERIAALEQAQKEKEKEKKEEKK